VALNSGSIRVLNLPGDGAVKPLPVNVQAGDARIVMRGADLESAVKRDLTTGPETFTRLNQGTGILSNGIKTLDLAVNGVNSATKARIIDAPISALPPVGVRPLAEGAPVKDLGVAAIQVAAPKAELINTLPGDLRGTTDLAVNSGLKTAILSAPVALGSMTNTKPLSVDVVVPPRSFGVIKNPDTGLLDLTLTGTAGKGEILPTVTSPLPNAPTLNETLLSTVVKSPTTVPIIDPSKLSLFRKE
jgi:hypothetical protein